MKRKHGYLFISLVLIGVMVLSMGCGGSKQAEPAKPEKIKMGILYSTTGGGSALGTAQSEGAKLAINEINAAGGVTINGKNYLIEGVFRDDETKPDVATRRFREMVENDGVKVIVGGTFSHISAAISEQTKTTPAFFMATNGVPEAFFAKATKSPTTLCNVGSTVSAGRSGAAYVATKMKPKKVVLVLPDYAYGHDQATGAESIFKKYPEIQVVKIMTPVGTADMTPYLIKAKEAKADVIMMGHWGNDAINAIKQASELKLASNSKVWFNWMVNVFATGIPAEALDGLTSQMLWYHDMSAFRDKDIVDASQKFKDAWMKVTQDPPDPYAMAAYMGVKETVRGIKLAQSTDPLMIVAAILSNPGFESMNGKAAWRQDGRPMYKYWPYIIEGKGAADRKDPKWDFAKVVNAYEGGDFLPPLQELGY